MRAGCFLEVDRRDPARQRFVEEAPPEQLSDGEVLLAVDHFALTTNNITYHSVGDSLGYWRFFPTGDEAWGRLPVMGYADVVASAHPDVAIGERVWGFFPMGTHLLIRAGKVHLRGFADVSPHRNDLAPAYAQFQRAAANPIYEAAREEQDCLLRGLFLTAWLCEDALHDHDYHAAGDCLITSASSKTSIALASCMRERSALRSIGLTSERNLAFCESLGCYDRIISYDAIPGLPKDRGALLIDMAGNAAVNRAVHEHYGRQLRYDCRIGITHRDAPPAGDVELPGPRPEMFFAPHQAQKRGREWGPEVLEQRIGLAFARFREFSDGWLRVRRFDGRDAALQAFGEILRGEASPAEGYSVSLSRDA